MHSKIFEMKVSGDIKLWISVVYQSDGEKVYFTKSRGLIPLNDFYKGAMEKRGTRSNSHCYLRNNCSVSCFCDTVFGERLSMQFLAFESQVKVEDFH